MSAQAKTIAILTAKPDKEVELEDLLRTLQVASRQEPGNLRWDLWRDHDNSSRFFLDELYHDDTAVAAHRASPHFQHYLSRIPDLADRLSVTGHAVDVT